MEREGGGRTGERRGDRAPANVAKMRDNALLERGPELLAGELDLLRACGGCVKRTAGAGVSGAGDELDEEPAVLHRKARLVSSASFIIR